MLLPIFAILVLIVIGIPLSYWVRIIQLHGFELWLPFGIVIAIAISPLAGFLFALAIIIGAWLLFPFDLNTLALELLVLASTMFLTALLPITPATLVFYSVLVAVSFNVASNILFVFLGFDPLKAMKFAAFSIWLTWLITTKGGWAMVEFFAI